MFDTLDMHTATDFLSCLVLQYIRTCMQAKEPPHLTLVHTSNVKAMFDKDITAIGAVVTHKSSNPPLPLPPKRRVPTVSSATRVSVRTTVLLTFCFAKLLSFQYLLLFSWELTKVVYWQPHMQVNWLFWLLTWLMSHLCKYDWWLFGITRTKLRL